MKLRPEVEAFVRGGPLPNEGAEEELIAARQRQIEAITRPVTEEEARALAACFGIDDCFGLAWNLLHLVETGSAGIDWRDFDATNEWIQLLRDRALRGGNTR